MKENMTETILTVTLYHRADDPETMCVEEELVSIQSLIPHRVVKINVENDNILRERYYDNCPVVEVGPYLVKSPISKTDLVATMGATKDRLAQLSSANDKTHSRKSKHGSELTGFDKFSYSFSKWYMLWFNLLVLLYVGLPFLAPIMQKAGWEGPAKVIYTIYKPFCHQLAFRSWFILGEQAYYPRDMAGISNVRTYEEITGNDSHNLEEARAVIGNEKMGYKVALCERDVAIYGSIFLFGLVFMLTGRKIKPVPWYLWVFLGIAPIGLDGVSQIPSLSDLNLPVWIMRESTPLLRTITGGLFGLMTAWYLYPMIEESMRDTRIILSKKIASFNQLLHGRN